MSQDQFVITYHNNLSKKCSQYSLLTVPSFVTAALTSSRVTYKRVLLVTVTGLTAVETPEPWLTASFTVLPMITRQADTCSYRQNTTVLRY